MNAGPGRLHSRGRVDLGDYPVDAAWLPDGNSLVVAGGEGAVLRVTAGSTAVERLGQHAGGALAVAAQRAGRLFASAGQDGAVLLWDSRTLESKPIHQGKEWCERLAFADGGRWLAAAAGRTLHLFDDTGAAMHQLAGHAGAIAALAWRPKVNEIAAAGNNGARVHRVDRTVQSRDLAAGGACLTANWNPDGRMLAAGMQDGTLSVWNVAAGSAAVIPGFGARVFATEWSPNGAWLAAAAGATLAVWDAKARSKEPQVSELRAHSERLTALCFRPTGSWLVSAARDRRLLLWRVGVSDQPQDAHLLPDECTLLRFSRDGSVLAAGDAQGGLTIYDCAA
jgi:WD40 repeat protein